MRDKNIVELQLQKNLLDVQIQKFQTNFTTSMVIGASLLITSTVSFAVLFLTRPELIPASLWIFALFLAGSVYLFILSQDYKNRADELIREIEGLVSANSKKKIPKTTNASHRF